MKHTETENHAAASAAGRELDTALQRNPLVALATGLVSPILGLFRRRPIATTVEKTKLEHYRSTPVPVTHTGRSKDERTTNEGRTNDVSERHTVAVRSYVRRAPQGQTAARKGGTCHG